MRKDWIRGKVKVSMLDDGEGMKLEDTDATNRNVHFSAEMVLESSS